MLTKQSAHRKDTRNAPASFTHQHFRKVAEIIRTYRKEWPTELGRIEVAEHFADCLATTNPNFDRHRFLMACQPAE